MFDSLRPHELQHARPPCPSPTPGVHSNSCSLSQWCHPAISSSVVPFSSCPQFLPASVFSNESTLHMRWPKYWSFSFSISPSSEHPGLISFRMDWLDLLAVQGTLKSLTVRSLFAMNCFPGGSDGKESAICNVGDPGSIPELGRSPGEGNGNPLQYSCLENPMSRGAWRTAVHGVAKSRTRLSDYAFKKYICDSV